MQFSKKEFQEKYNPKKKINIEKTDKEEEIDEVVIGGNGDKVITHNEISTDTQVSTTVDKSGREKGMSKTMDKHISQSRNPTARFGLGGEMGTPYGAGGGRGIHEDELKESPKDKMRRMVKELMDSRTKENDFVSRNNKSNENEVPLLDGLNDVMLESKVDELLRTLLDKSPDDVGTVLNYITYHIENNKNNNI